MNGSSKNSGDLGVTAGDTLHTGKAFLTGVSISAAAADVVVTIYDNTAASGTVVLKYTLDISVDGLSTYVHLPHVRCDTGLTAVVTGTGAVVMVHYK